MIVVLVVTFSLLVVSVGQYVITCPNSSVKAGTNVIILCKVDPYVDLSAETLDIKRIDSKAVFHSYRHYKDNPDLQAHQYRNRTDLNHADLSRGIVTLNFSSVNQSDKGTYKIFVLGLKASSDFHIDVVERSQLNKTISNNVSTTEPTETSVTESDNHDAAKTKVGLAIACIMAVVALFFVLVMFRNNWIGMLIKKLKRNKGGTEEDNLMTRKERKKADADNLIESKV